MAGNVLKNKFILAVDDDRDILEVIAEELEDFGVDMDRVSTYQEAIEHLTSTTYDVVILDIMGVRGFELLQYAVGKKMPVIMLTAHALSPEALKRSIELGARAYLPKDQLGQLAPFIEDVITLNYYSGWNSLFSKLGGSFGKRFGSNWRSSEAEFWEKFEKDMEVKQSTILES